MTRSHRQRVAEFPFKYVVNVGGSDHPVMESIAVNVKDDRDATPFGYSDGVDAGRAALRPHEADGRRQPREEQAVHVLTGAVGLPGIRRAEQRHGAHRTASSARPRRAACRTGGASAGAQARSSISRSTLERFVTAGAFRAHLFGYPFWDALEGTVQDRIEVFTSVDGVTFASQGLLETSLWRKDVPINTCCSTTKRRRPGTSSGGPPRRSRPGT